MKNCKILVGPIAGDNGVNHNEGDVVALDDVTAVMFVRFGYVTIELEPTLPASGLSGFKDEQDLATGVDSVPLTPDPQIVTPDPVDAAALQEPSVTPEPEVKESRKSKKTELGRSGSPTMTHTQVAPIED